MKETAAPCHAEPRKPCVTPVVAGLACFRDRALGADVPFCVVFLSPQTFLAVDVSPLKCPRDIFSGAKFGLSGLSGLSSSYHARHCKGLNCESPESSSVLQS